MNYNVDTTWPLGDKAKFEVAYDWHRTAYADATVYYGKYSGNELAYEHAGEFHVHPKVGRYLAEEGVDLPTS
jgi:hypothetical protein